MRIFKNKWFARFARREGIDDGKLCDAVARAERGLFDADLGGGVIKQRIAREGKGRSGGYRRIIFFRSGERAFFVYAFAKNDRDNLEPAELRAFKEAAVEMLRLKDDMLRKLIANETLMEVNCDG